MRWWLVFTAVSLIACGPPEEEVDGTPVWGSLPNDHATHFQVQVRGAERRMVVFGDGGPADTIGIHPLSKREEGSQVGGPQRVALTSTTHLPFFEVLGCLDQVVGLAHTDLVRDPALQERVVRGQIKEIGRAGDLDREVLLALDPDVVFNYPFGQDGQEQVHPPSIAVTEYLEDHPLGRAEWVRFFGILLGKERTADSLYNAIAHRYTVARKMVQYVGETPLVLFGSQWEERWWMPHGRSYMATLINDAGGRYWVTNTTAQGNIPITLEEILVAAETCEHFGVVLAKEGKVTSLDLAGGDPRVAALDAVRKGGFVGNSARNDLFGKALLEPEVILKDLRCIFHPRSCANYTARYFFPLDQ